MITELQYEDVALTHISSPEVRYDYSCTAKRADNTDSATSRVAAGIAHVTVSESLFDAAHSFISLLSSVPTAGRLRLKCDGTHAETRFRLSTKRTSPFK